MKTSTKRYDLLAIAVGAGRENAYHVQTAKQPAAYDEAVNRIASETIAHGLLVGAGLPARIAAMPIGPQWSRNISSSVPHLPEARLVG